MTRSLALAALVALAALAACDGAAEPGTPLIPADHPCPDRALPPADPGLWWHHVDVGAPVPLALALPLPPGLPVMVSQGNAQDPTHHGDNAWAWDFAVPVGTPVHAAAPGVVTYVRDDSIRHGSDASFREDANLVVVDHGAGLFTAYVHLAAGSAAVAPGDRVAGGALLAATGLSGQLSGPHLHFQLENVWSHSLPARFVAPGGLDGCDLRPDTGDVVTAGPRDGHALVSAAEVSAMPSDAFGGYGLIAAQGLPARLLTRERPYRVSGAVEDGAGDVVLLLLPPEGGYAVASWRLPVRPDGGFAGEVDLRGLAPGRYGLGAIAVAPGEAARVDAAIRVTVR